MLGRIQLFVPFSPLENLPYPRIELASPALADRFFTTLVAQIVKNLSAMQETQIRSLCQKDSPGDGNGNPPQYSCLENPVDRGAWWAIVHGGHKESDTTERPTLYLCFTTQPPGKPKMFDTGA